MKLSKKTDTIIDETGKIGNQLKKYYGVIGVILLASGIFFLSPNLTGNAVANVAQGNSNWIGGILFVLGLIGVYSWAK